MPRTQGVGLHTDAATVWSAEASSIPGVLAVRSRVAGVRATNRAVERFYTTVSPIRERATEGWHVSTLTMKEN